MPHLRVVPEVDLPDVPDNEDGSVTRRPTDNDILQMGMKVLVRLPNGDIIMDVPGMRVRTGLPGALHRKDIPTRTGVESRWERATGTVRSALGGNGDVAHSWGD